VAAAAVGGRWVGLATAVASALVVNWFFIPPLHTLSVERRDNLITLLVYALVATTVSVVMEAAARARAAAARHGLEARLLALEAARADELAEVDRLRTALLAAVGHDLRTPLASIKAAASSLRLPDVDFTPAQEAELVATIDESADRLDDLVANLLAVSRLQAGVLSVQARPVAVDEVVARALLHADPGRLVSVDIADDLPLALVDPGLLERVVANLVANALRETKNVTVRGSAGSNQVTVSVIDHGPGIAAGDLSRAFEPFQRLDDRTNEHGLGVGLAIARGFTEAMGGTLTPSQTAGGGLTMTVALPTGGGQ
jgi:two-component system sensor histidine kinase KdpD